MLGIVFTDLLTGIGLGMAVAIFFILLNNYRNPYFLPNEPHKPGEVIQIKLSEDVSFLNRASIMRTLDEIPANCKVEIDASRSASIDYDVYELIQNYEEKAKMNGTELKLIGFTALKQENDSVRRIRRVIRRQRRLTEGLEVTTEQIN